MDKFEDLKGRSIAKIEGGVGDDLMLFITNTGKKYYLYHEQD